MHLYKPANIYAALWDHDYLKQHPETVLLKSLNLYEVSYEKIREIEINTRMQRLISTWANERKHHITASNVYKVMTVKSDAAKKNLAKRIFNPQEVKCKETDYGILNEPKALRLYESYGIKITSCGLFISKRYPHIAATPDGLVGNDTVVEVKCPYTKRGLYINEDAMSCLYKDPISGRLVLHQDHEYYTQIQTQLFAAEKKYANLVLYTENDFKVIDVPRNDEIIGKIVDQVTDFYNNYFRPLILEHYLYKNYNSIFSQN